VATEFAAVWVVVAVVVVDVPEWDARGKH